MAGPCEFHCFPHGAGNHRRAYIMLMSAIDSAGLVGTTEDIFSVLRCPSSLRVSSVCSQGAAAPITPSLLPVSGPSRGQQTHPTDFNPGGGTYLKLVWTFSWGSSSSCLTPHRISAVWPRLPTHPRLLICLSYCTK